MTLDDLQSITRIKDRDALDILKQGAKDEIKLFTVVKQDLRFSYDLVEFHICPSTDTEQMSVCEHDQIKSFDRGEIIELPIEAIEELWLYRKLEGKKLALAFPPPTEDHKIHSTAILDVIELDDVYIDKNAMAQPPKQKSPKTKKHHTRAIEAALVALGKGATNDRVYNWIKTESENPSEEHKEYMNYLDFDDYDIDPFDVTDQKATILKSNNRPISKQTFQDACSKAKKNLTYLFVSF